MAIQTLICVFPHVQIQEGLKLNRCFRIGVGFRGFSLAIYPPSVSRYFLVNLLIINLLN